MQAQSVLEVVSNRLIRRNLGLDKADSFRLALAVEGGGMRGILSASMLLALQDLGMLDIFDCYVGVSAGGLNLAYSLAGQGSVGLSMYMENMTDGTILNLRRVRDKEVAMLDMRQLHQQTTGEKALNETALAANYKDSFYISAANVSKREGVLMNPATAGDKFHEFLLAGATMPVVSGKPWHIDGDDYFDGGLVYGDPSLMALELGCSHVLVLNTQYVGHVKKAHNRFGTYIMKRLDETYNGSGSWYVDNLRQHAEAFAGLPYGEATYRGMHLYRHALAQPSGVNRLTTDKAKLVNGTLAAYQSVLDLFYRQGKAGVIPTLL